MRQIEKCHFQRSRASYNAASISPLKAYTYVIDQKIASAFISILEGIRHEGVYTEENRATITLLRNVCKIALLWCKVEITNTKFNSHKATRKIYRICFGSYFLGVHA